jgi:hypothetical protein
VVRGRGSGYIRAILCRNYFAVNSFVLGAELKCN